jgi:hypothetical protein
MHFRARLPIEADVAISGSPMPCSINSLEQAERKAQRGFAELHEMNASVPVTRCHERDHFDSPDVLSFFAGGENRSGVDALAGFRGYMLLRSNTDY